MGVSAVVLLLVLGFAISCSTIPLIRRWSRATAEHQPHHTHTGSVCRLGGLGLAVAFAVLGSFGLWYSGEFDPSSQSFTIMAGCLAMFTLGFIDDLRPLGAKRKLVVQIAIASAVYYAGVDIGHFKNPLTGVSHALGPWSYVATVFWLVAFTNLINLIDGV